MALYYCSPITFSTGRYANLADGAALVQVGSLISSAKAYEKCLYLHAPTHMHTHTHTHAHTRTCTCTRTRTHTQSGNTTVMVTAVGHKNPKANTFGVPLLVGNVLDLLLICQVTCSSSPGCRWTTGREQQLPVGYHKIFFAEN